MIRQIIFFVALWLPWHSALANSSSNASGTLVLTGSNDRYALEEHTRILEDPSSGLTIDDVISAELANRWQRNTQSTPNFAFSDSAYWLHIRLESGLPADKAWLFELAFALHDYIDFYVVDGNRVLSKTETGDRRPFHSRPFDYRNFLFEVKVPAGTSRDIYLRLATHDGLHEPSPMILWDKDAFALENGTRNLGLGLSYGIMLVMAIYNLFIYLSVRDSTYLYYVGYILSFSGWLFSYHGFAFQYLWPESPVLANQAIVFMNCAWAIFTAQFVRMFLNAKTYAPWLIPICRAYITLLVGVTITGLLGHYAIAILTIIFAGCLACLTAIAAGVSSYRRGYQPAYYFLLAWSTLLLSIIVFCLKSGGVIPTNWLVERAVQIGCVAEVVLLSLGLASRINSLKQQAYLAQKASLQAVESNLKLKNDFITSITHELRTPMNAVVGGLELIESRQFKNPESPLEIVKSGANDMMRLINDILSHTEIQSGQLKIQRDATNVRQLFDPILASYRAEAEAKGLTFIADFNLAASGWIETDPDKLLTLSRKLLDNAIKFTPSGSISFQVTLQNGEHSRLVLSVRDSGPGIPEAIQEQIYSPFTQADSGFQRTHGGIGIGLCICQNLVHALDGRILLDSAPGKGSTFVVQLPVTPCSPPKATTPLKSHQELPVMIVEDNPVNRLVLSKMLKNLNLEVIIANHGQEALELLNQQQVSMILMDLQMPVMDGFTCTARIRERTDSHQHIPIIAVSANLMDVDKSRCVESGMNDFLQKPVRMSLLRECLLRFISIPGTEHQQTGESQD